MEHLLLCGWLFMQRRLTPRRAGAPVPGRAGHVAALRKLDATPAIGCTPYNLGTGTGTTVLEMVHAFEAASGLKVPLKLVARRPGDAEAVWAATDTAERELGWKAKLTVKEMCEDQWKWASDNPSGYDVEKGGDA